MTRINRISILYAVILVAGMGSQARAEEGEVKFSYRSHELQSAAGAERVFRRIQRTAARACRAEAPLDQRGCRKDLVKQLVVKIGDPTILAKAGESKRIQLADRGG